MKCTKENETRMRVIVLWCLAIALCIGYWWMWLNDWRAMLLIHAIVAFSTFIVVGWLGFTGKINLYEEVDE